MVLALACGKKPQLLGPGSWDPSVRESLDSLLASGSGGYAVFDFDKTSIVHDISQALWVYQIENLRYADAPSDSLSTRLDSLPASLPIPHDTLLLRPDSLGRIDVGDEEGRDEQ